MKDVTAVGVLGGSGGFVGAIEEYASGRVDPRESDAAVLHLEPHLVGVGEEAWVRCAFGHGQTQRQQDRGQCLQSSAIPHGGYSATALARSITSLGEA